MSKFISSLIESCGGLQNFSLIIKEYNEYAKANYLTNKDIISLYSNKKTINK